MPFEKGKPRHPKAGRKRGTPNERTKAEDACLRAGICPFDLLVAGAMAGDMGAIIQLCKHVEPPRKALDVAVDPENNAIKFIFEDYTKK